jgi:SEC-C motif-containing protein
MSCPCGKGESLEVCCGPIIKGQRPAATAEELMRSRYACYVTGDIDHVVATHDPATRGDVDRDAAEAWARSSQWHGLEIVATEAGSADDATGIVEFIARYTLGGKTLAHHERSRFARKDEGSGPRWFYIDGDMIKARPVAREAAKVGRNEPCPCGSGKKYKKCHGQAA